MLSFLRSLLRNSRTPSNALRSRKRRWLSHAETLEERIVLDGTPPALDFISDVTIHEDAGSQIIVLSVTTDAPPHETPPLRVAAASSNTGVIPHPTVTNAGDDETEFHLTFTPVADQYGAATITVTVEDGGPDGDLNTTGDNLSTSGTFLVTVTPVNDSPTVEAVSDVTFAEDSPGVVQNLTVTAGPFEREQGVNVIAESNNPDILVDVTLGTGILPGLENRSFWNVGYGNPVLDGEFYFAGQYAGQPELWRTDGDTSEMLLSEAVGTLISPNSVAVTGSRITYVVSADHAPSILKSYDPATGISSVLVEAFDPVITSGYNHGSINGKRVFALNAGGLLVTDGTTAGTGILPGLENRSFWQVGYGNPVLDSEFYFAGDHAGQPELWRTDGETTEMLVSEAVGTFISLHSVAVTGSRITYVVSADHAPSTLKSYDPTTGVSSVLVENFDPIITSGYNHGSINGKRVFGVNAGGLLVTDGTTAGTGILPGLEDRVFWQVGYGNPVLDDEFYFAGQHAGQAELWRTDGETTEMLLSEAVGTFISTHSVAVTGSRITYVVSADHAPSTLKSYDPTTGISSVLVEDFDPVITSGYNHGSINGKRVFALNAGSLLVTDGTTVMGGWEVSVTATEDYYGTGTVTLDVQDCGDDGLFETLDDNLSISRTFDVTVTPVNDSPTVEAVSDVTFAEDSPGVVQNLTVTAGPFEREQGVNVIAESNNPDILVDVTLGTGILPGLENRSFLHVGYENPVLDGQFYFVGQHAGQSELWRTDGVTTELLLSEPVGAWLAPDSVAVTGSRITYVVSAAGGSTRMLKSYDPTTSISAVLVEDFDVLLPERWSQGSINGKSVFALASGSLLVTDGTTAGTSVLPGSENRSFLHVGYENPVLDGQFYFVGQHAGKSELWRTDGVTTELLLSEPVGAWLAPDSVAVTGSRITYVVSAAGGSTRMLKSYDPTTSVSSVLVEDFDVLLPERWSQGSINGKSVFALASGGLLVTDGTTAGTSVLPGLENRSFPHVGYENPVLDGQFYFVGQHAGKGELWRTDGVTTELLLSEPVGAWLSPDSVAVTGSRITYVVFAAGDSARTLKSYDPTTSVSSVLVEDFDVLLPERWSQGSINGKSVFALASGSLLVTDGTTVMGGWQVSVTATEDYYGTGTVTLDVQDSGDDGLLETLDDNLSISRTFDVTVTPVNDTPTLGAIADVTIHQDAAAQTVELGGITAGGGEVQPLRVTITSNSNPTLIPSPAVNYISDSTTGSIAFTPAGDESGMSTMMVTVEDGGLDEDLSTVEDNATFSREFTVWVNAPPTVDSLPSQPLLGLGAGMQSVVLTGITAGGGEEQLVQVTASSSSEAIIGAPAVSYSAAETIATLQYAPTGNALGDVTLTVTVTDAGFDGDFATTEDNGVFERQIVLHVDAAPWSNLRFHQGERQVWDVDDSGEADLRDALMLVNLVNRFPEYDAIGLPTVPTDLNQDGMLDALPGRGLFPDVNGDGRTSLADPLAIVNKIHQLTSVQELAGEGEGRSADYIAVQRLNSERAGEDESEIPSAMAAALTVGSTQASIVQARFLLEQPSVASTASGSWQEDRRRDAFVRLWPEWSQAASGRLRDHDLADFKVDLLLGLLSEEELLEFRKANGGR